MLSNDHKAITAEIEKQLHALHAQSRDEGNAPAAASGARPAAPVPAAASPPFALVDEVSAGSPAAAAGLCVGDLLLSLGEATAASGGLAAVAEVVRASQGRPVRAVVLRAGAPLALQLVPSPWGGRGLLGCHLQPIVR